jgi:CBS domain-containing protein
MTDTMAHPNRGRYVMPPLEYATVADAMHPGIVCCLAGAPLRAVARIMASHHVHCVAVMGLGEGEVGEPPIWGLIYDRDVLRAGMRIGEDETAAGLAHQPVITVQPTCSLRAAGELMLTRAATHLVVVHPETQLPLGMLSALDVAGVLAWAGVTMGAGYDATAL